jgi:hypothetical protein
MPTVFLGAIGPLLIVLHALAAITLAGASVHHAVIATQVLRGQPLRSRLARLYSLVTLCAYSLSMVSGGLVYPRYRYFVRGLYLDRYAPWAANLFDFKENLATLGLPLAIGAYVVARDLTQKTMPQSARLFYGLFALGTALVSLFNLIAGLLCTSVRGI